MKALINFGEHVLKRFAAVAISAKLAVADVHGGTPSLCGQGHLDLDIGKGKFDINLGTPSTPVYFVSGCVGYALEGWINITKTDVFLGAGIRAQMEFDSPWIGLGSIASIKPYVGFNMAAGIHTKLKYAPKFVINDVGMWMHASAGLHCGYKWLGDEGMWDLGTVTLAGNFNVHLQPAPVIVSGILKGSASFLDHKVSFEVEGKYEFE